MPADSAIGQLLRTLVASRPGGRILELGTGTGLSLAWMVDGLSDGATIHTLDNDTRLIDFVGELFADDDRVTVACTDGAAWLTRQPPGTYDLVFADTWPGKYNHLEQALSLLRVGGMYIIDDMLPQANWPNGHDALATALLEELNDRKDFAVVYLPWSTGVVIATRLS